MDFSTLGQKSLAYSICYLQKDFKNYCEAVLEPYGLTNGLYFYLIFVNKHPGCSLHEMTIALRVDKSHTTRTVAHLEKMGYVHKERSKSDSRCFRILVSDEGEAILAKIKDIFAQWDSMIAAHLPEGAYDQLMADLYEVKKIKREGALK